MKLTTYVLLLQIGLGSSLSAIAQHGSLKGVITDSEAGVIFGAHILIHADGAGRRSMSPADVSMITDKSGQFQVTLKPGFYDVCAMADAFTPDCRKVFVSSNNTVPYSIRLNADPEVTKKLGDKF